MKKIVAILLIACLVSGGVIGFLEYRNGQPAAEPSAETPSTEAPAAAAPAAESPLAEEDTAVPSSLDLERLYATRAADEVVMTVDGQDETWGDYFYFLASQVRYVEEYFTMMANYYGLELSWKDVAEGEDETYAQLAAESVEAAMRQFGTIEGFARANGVTLTEANREAMARQLQLDMEAACGENATEADFDAYLKSRYLNREMYERINAVNALYQEGFRKLYGENSELMDEAAVLAFLEENDYLSANHILLMTVDPLSGEALDEKAAEEKAETAARLAAELQAIEDPAERLERFSELKEEYCEDSGKTLYPAGYTFTPGTMVEEFETACRELEDYQVSDPVASSYGYHILMRLPLDVDALLFNSSSTPLTARATLANTEYGQRLQAYMDGLEVSYAEGFTLPNLLDYLDE